MQKKHALFDSKSFKVCGRSYVYSNNIFYLSLSIKHKDLTRKLCVYFLFHWFSGENCMFLLSLHKGQQTSKELKRNMNGGTNFFLMSLLIVFFIKKWLWRRCFPVNFVNFLRTLFWQNSSRRLLLAFNRC